MDLSDTVRERADRLAELQRAMFIVGRDIEQLTRRPVRDAFGDPTAAVVIGDSPMIEFTRRGWQNPLHSPRTELQRVAYTVEEGTLIRLFWPVLDRGPNTEPIAQELLTGVQEVAFLAHDGTGEEYSYWPLDPSLGNDDKLPCCCRVPGRPRHLWPTGPIVVGCSADGFPARTSARRWSARDRKS